MSESIITRDCFIIAFIEIMKRVLKKELPKKATEKEFIELAYDSVYKRIRHIKTHM